MLRRLTAVDHRGRHGPGGALMGSEPTLLEDLEAMVLPHTDAFVAMTGERAARLRAAAVRLREEMERAELLRDMIVNDVKQNNVVHVLERINGGSLNGPAKPPEGET